MRNIIMLIMAIMLIATKSQAQNNALNLQAETRIDYSGEFFNSDASNGKASFNGRYLNVMLSGTIGDKFSYAYRQRLNKAHADQSFFDATDWLYLTYAPSNNWPITAATSIHHFSRPLQRKRPRMKRKTVMAPMYIGPAVNG